MPAIDQPVAQWSAQFPARPEGLAEFHAAWEQFLGVAGRAGVPIPVADQIPIMTAAAEIVANIAEHACVGIPGAQVTLLLSRRPGSVEAVFEDPGVAFVAEEVEAPDSTPQGGMGLNVARSSLHVLDYERHGSTNRWRLERRTRPTNAQAPS